MGNFTPDSFFFGIERFAHAASRRLVVVDEYVLVDGMGRERNKLFVERDVPELDGFTNRWCNG